jgi:L,D-transpeptidase YcbB
MTFAKLPIMNKILLLVSLLISTQISCQDNGNSVSGESKSSKSKKEKSELEKKVSKRDLSITRANSYSDLFFDSLAMENFISTKKLSDTLTRRIRSFYNTRNYQFAWFTSEGLTEEALGFWNLLDYAVSTGDKKDIRDKGLQTKVDQLITNAANSDNGKLRISAADKNILETELAMTQHFIRYTLRAYEDGYVKRKEMERFIPRKKEDAVALADSLLKKKHKDDKYYEDVNQAYRLLKNELGTYYNIVTNGGWPTIKLTKKKLAKGVSAPEVIAIKRRLHTTGELPGEDTSAVFTDSLTMAVRLFQQKHGFTADGIVTEALVKEMNVPALTRLQQILMNMNRMRWMPQQPEGKLILVNIPEFVLHFYEGKTKAFDMAVVVGKVGHNTMMFTGDLNQVVFSPYWNVPDNIVRKEILPAMNRNRNYLASQNMEVVGNRGDLPVIRQKPGEKNSLGRVKFLFPNSFDIYFHDTPAKSLFSKDKRAFSHGCIRLSDPEKMANYLLKDDKEWTPEKIREAMMSGKEKFVKLKEPVPVFITYYTAWVDENGALNFRDDIYKHDEDLRKKMF